MALNSQEGQKELKEWLKEKEREVSLLCANYRRELAKPILSTIPNAENVFERVFVSLITWGMLFSLLTLEIMIAIENVENDNVAIMIAIAIILIDITILYYIDKTRRESRINGFNKKLSLGIQLLKLVPIGLIILIALTNIKAHLSNNDGNIDILSAVINGGGYALVSILIYGVLLVTMASKGTFLENLLSIYELSIEKKEYQKLQNNSRNEEVLIQISQDIKDTTGIWLNGVNRYGTIYNPIGENGEPNQNFIKFYTEWERQTFVYEPYQHSLTEEDIRTINAIYGGEPKIAEYRPLENGGNDVSIEPEPPTPPTGLGGGTLPPNEDFNEPKGIVV